MTRSSAPFLFVLLAATAQAEPAGPPTPLPSKRSAAEQNIARQAVSQTQASSTGCPPSRRGEIVVCGGDRSPYRLPLPDERGPAAGARIATGDRDMVVDPGSPMPGPRGVGLQLKVPLGKAATAADPLLHGLGGGR